MRHWGDLALYCGVVGIAVWTGRRADLGNVAYVANVLPYGPPAALLLVGYLGGQINQSRILFTSTICLLATYVLGHQSQILPEAIGIIGHALPISLALIFVVPESRVLGARGLLRLMLVLAPPCVFIALHVLDPDTFAWIIGRRLQVPGVPQGIPVALLVCTLPLALTAIALRRDPLGSLLPALLVAQVPFLADASITLPPAGLDQALTGARAAVAFTALSGILLHGVVRLYRSLAYRDELTGLPNRRALEEELGRLTPPYAIVMIDIDHFKRFNDRYGHDQGDEVLRYAATHLADSLGSKFYRYGGEEFCALLTGVDLNTAHAMTEHARQNLVHLKFQRRSQRGWRSLVGPGRIISPGARALRFTVSAGLAAPRTTSTTPQRVLAEADAALYRAKAAGRNQVIVAGRRRPVTSSG